MEGLAFEILVVRPLQRQSTSCVISSNVAFNVRRSGAG